jgi:hypothetical protein
LIDDRHFEGFAFQFLQGKNLFPAGGQLLHGRKTASMGIMTCDPSTYYMKNKKSRPVIIEAAFFYAVYPLNHLLAASMAAKSFS